jgi:hypothetical protein
MKRKRAKRVRSALLSIGGAAILGVAVIAAAVYGSDLLPEVLKAFSRLVAPLSR